MNSGKAGQARVSVLLKSYKPFSFSFITKANTNKFRKRFGINWTARCSGPCTAAMPLGRLEPMVEDISKNPEQQKQNKKAYSLV
ncbi:hypothetical protein B1757_12455 [Acidithiobacillus marinus]|uniref:Uncharacterized protein n=1 Tax=Acidithiobacillus marinus TaxID=187490 RepID=A0A2I1DJ15_9PROT|nr:hypothetical protein B1757_12455 [Acidithiobacillus marinus]